MTAQLDTRLYDYLKELTIVDLKTLDNTLSEAKSSQKPLSDLLVEKDILTDENLGKVMSDLLSVPLVRLSAQVIPPQVLRLLPSEYAHKNLVIVFKVDGSTAYIAINDPQRTDILNAIEKKLMLKSKVYFATKRDIEETLNQFRSDKKAPTNASVTDMIQHLVQGAYDSKASDIHIEPLETGSVVRFRIDGILHDETKLTSEAYQQLVSKIKVESRLRTDEHMSAQDGRMSVKVSREELDIRVSIVPVINGESVVLRLLSSRSRQFGLNDLGLQERDRKKVETAFKKPYGMVLSTGPTGSGKTTSIYSILKLLNSRDRKIETIEDPVEYYLEGINQIQVNTKTNLTFSEGLRSILRQDPDVIFIGEIRDSETADIAVNSAMTGHLVLSTLHTNDAATALPRLADMGIEPFLIASSVNVIVAQRLVRKICEKCKVSKELTPTEIIANVGEEFYKNHFKTKTKLATYQGKGCPICKNTGYTGRIGVFEVLEVTDSIRKLINTKASADEISKTARVEGMTTMTEDGIEKVKLGLTTLEEVLRVTKE